MQLLGMRRSFSPLTVLSIFFLFLTTTSAAVLGIDLGTEYIKAALVKPGAPLDIVLTKDSKRKEAAAVAFKPVKQKSSSKDGVFPERAYGSDAVALSARFPGDNFMNIKSLLGILATDPAVQQYGVRYPGATVEEEQMRKTVALRSQTFTSDELPFEVEELLAMQLQNIAANAQAAAGSKIRNVVVTVPAYWTVEEKDAVRNAVELAGLQLLALTTDGLAVGLNYAMTRTFATVNDGSKNKPEYHIVYDMGAGGTTATVLKMQARNVKDVGRFNKTVQEVYVAGVGWDKTLGGDALNTLILNDMIDKLAESDKIKALGASREMVAKDGRTVSKLWKESERLRQVLSANTETQASFEGIYSEDVSFKYKLKRTDYEQMAEDYVQRLKNPIDQAMHSARLEFSDIESIIVYGGAQRTPFVHRALESAIGKADKVRNNVNADEAAAFGAAFLGASLSPIFRVKEIRTYEAGIHDVWISWDQEGKQKKQKIFTEVSQASIPKQLPFNKLEDFEVEIFQQVLDGDNMRNIPVWTVKTTNLTKSAKELGEKHGCPVEDIKTQLEVVLSAVDNLPEVVGGSVSCEIADDGKKGGIVDGIKGLFGGKKDDQKVVKGDSVDADSSSTEEASSAASADAKETPANKDDTKSKEAKKKTVSVPVGVLTETTKRSQQLSLADRVRIQGRLSKFRTSDEDRAKRSEALNQLEAYSYRVRDMLENEDFMAVSTEEQRSEISQKSRDASEWLYGDGSEAVTSEFEKRLAELKSLVKPVEKRKTESAGRSEAVEMLEHSIDSSKKMLDSMRENAEKAWDEYSSSVEAASATSSAATTSSVEVDELDELDDETATAESTPTPIAEPVFKPEDFDSAIETTEEIEEWLKKKLEAQAKLVASEDPVLLVADVRERQAKLTRITTDLLQKQLRAQNIKLDKPKSKSKKSTSKTKSTATKSPKASKSKSASTSGTASASASTSTHDEL